MRVRFVRTPPSSHGADLIVLPGSKSTAADLAWLRERGLGRRDRGRRGGRAARARHLRRLPDARRRAARPDGVESAAAADGRARPACRWRRPVARDKTTVRVRGRVAAGAGPFAGAAGTEVDAYEIHAGRTERRRRARPFTVAGRGGAGGHASATAR